MNEIKLERMTLQYTNISPFRLERVARAERARYIEDELDGAEPQPPQYPVQCGGGILPNGTRLDTWTELYDYTLEYIQELREESAGLEKRAHTPTAIARLAELRDILAVWDKHIETVRGLNLAVRKKRYEVGLWHTFKENIPSGDGWIDELAADGIDTSETPEDERKRLYYWLENTAVATQDEFQQLVDIAVQTPEQVKEARRVARAIFQRPLGQ